MILHPPCPNCGFELAAKIGTKIAVCVLCGLEWELREIVGTQKGLDAYWNRTAKHENTPKDITDENREKWK